MEEFACLPFGLASAMKGIYQINETGRSSSQTNGNSSNYLLGRHSNHGPLKGPTTLNLLESQGLIINYPKSHLVPSKQLEFLRHLLDSGLSPSWYVIVVSIDELNERTGCTMMSIEVKRRKWRFLGHACPENITVPQHSPVHPWAKGKSAAPKQTSAVL